MFENILKKISLAVWLPFGSQAAIFFLDFFVQKSWGSWSETQEEVLGGWDDVGKYPAKNQRILKSRNHFKHRSHFGSRY